MIITPTATHSDLSMTRRTFVRGAATAALAGGFASPLATGAAQGAEPKRGGVFKAVQIEPAVGFNPVLEGTNWPEIMRMVYNGLTDYGPAGELVPGVARSWTVSPDADTFTFQIQPGIMFHDAKELTSEDVKFTFEAIIDAKVASPLVAYVPNLKTVETPNKYTAVFKFNGPNVLMLPGISQLGILPKHLWAGVDPHKSEYLARPVGTGPFVLKEWQRSDYVSFDANRNYFRQGHPYVNRAIFKVVADAATGVEAFKNGEFDAVFSQGMPGGLPYAQVRQLVQAKPANIVTSEFAQNFNQNLFMNCAQPPFDNLKVRQAIGYAINKDLVIRALLHGFGRAQDSIVGDLPALRWAHDPTIKAEYNVARANQLLDEAGFPRKGGSRFAITILATEGFRVKLSEALKAMLAQVGIESTIKSYTWSTYIARIRQERDTAGCLWSIFISRQVDPSLILDYLSPKNIKPGGANYSQWNNGRAGELIEAARATGNQSKRKAMYLDIQRIVADELPVIPLYNAVGVDLWHRSVEGLRSAESLTGTMQSVETAWLNR
jgi:peptide/nickel transport system substrate-binding protein